MVLTSDRKLLYIRYYLSFQSVCPYGDYYEPVESNYNDGDVEVFETFIDPFTLRDSSARDPSTGMDIVLNIRHDFNLDIEDISGSLLSVTVAAFAVKNS